MSKKFNCDYFKNDYLRVEKENDSICLISVDSEQKNSIVITLKGQQLIEFKNYISEVI